VNALALAHANRFQDACKLLEKFSMYILCARRCFARLEVVVQKIEEMRANEFESDLATINHATPSIQKMMSDRSFYKNPPI
jgi:hypothetical protein